MSALPRKLLSTEVRSLAEIIGAEPEVRRHLQLFCEDALGRLLFLLEGLYENAPDALFEQASSAADQEQLRGCFNAMRSLKKNAQRLSERFAALFRVAWFDPESLSLDQPVDAEVRAMIERSSRRARLLFPALLQRLEARFAASDATDSGNPLDPARLTLVFWLATDQLGLATGERSLLLPLFRRFVMDSYGQVLAAIAADIDRLDD